MSVRHVLLFCSQWDKEREKELRDMARDLKEVLGIKHEATAAIKLILKTGLLKQFKATGEERAQARRRERVKVRATVQAKRERRRGAEKKQG
jgi:hypothetical protein